MTNADLATAFAHAVIRLATTPAHRGDLTSAAVELAQMPGWQRRPEERRAGLREARRLVVAHCGVRAAERAINAA